MAKSLTKLKTSDYSIFKFHESNRIVQPSAIRDMINSLTFNDMLEFKPILVNSKMEVIDGQTRLRAAMELQIPIWYEINPDITIEDVICLQNQKIWNSSDFLHYYVNEGYEQYILLDQFLKKNNIGLRAAFSLFNYGRNKTFYKTFRSGEYKFPEKDELKDNQDKLIICKSIIQYIHDKTSGDRNYLKTATFLFACSDFLNLKSIDIQVFMKNLPYRLDLLHPCSRTNDYVNILRAIYNYRNKEPV